MPSPTGAERAPHDFDSLFKETVEHLESSIARIVAVIATVIGLLVLLGKAAGSALPLGVVGVSLGVTAWYTVMYLLLRARRFPSWLRYASSLVDVSLGSMVLLIDLHVRGSLFAVTAGGPPLYAVGVAMATLRLEPRLCLFAGVASATQLASVTMFALRPSATPEMLATGAYDGFVVLMKVIFLLGTGGLGAVASGSMRGLLQRLTQSAVERERVRSLLGMHVSEQVMEHLLSGDLRREGERRTITVCFTDIRDFTSLAESRPPEEVLRLLNLYFGRMCDIVAAHGGVVNKFLGDGMLIVYGAPTHQPDDAARALAAAWRMLAEVDRMREAGEFPGLRIGVGIHRGDAVVGNVGGAQRQEYTVIGDMVNTASRVQDLTKALGRPLVLTRECRQALEGCAVFTPLGTHSVKGRVQPLELFGVEDEAGVAAR